MVKIVPSLLSDVFVCVHGEIRSFLGFEIEATVLVSS